MAMRSSVVFFALPLLMGFGSAQDDLPVRQTSGFMCGFMVEPPRTPAEWRKRADTVVRVRVDSQSAFEQDRMLPNVLTAHEATVLSVIKGDPRAVVEGASQQFLQYGGRIRRSDHILASTWNSFDIMPIGTEWLLFLEWNGPLDGFTLFYREYGAVRIEGGKIAEWRGQGEGRWAGRPIEELLEALGR